MSKVDKKGKPTQQSLDLLDPAVQQEQANDLSFVLEIHVIEDVTLDEWIDDFRAKGASNWSTHDDPIAEWLKERQD